MDELSSKSQTTFDEGGRSMSHDLSPGKGTRIEYLILNPTRRLIKSSERSLVGVVSASSLFLKD